MNRVFLRKTLILFSGLSLAISQASAEPASNASNHETIKLQGVVVQNEVADALERLGIKCRVQEGKNYALAVDHLKLGSPAIYAGLSEGDVIQDLVQSGNKLVVAIKRDGHIYQIAIDEGGAPLLSGKAIGDFLKGYVNGGGAPKFRIQTPLLAKNNSKVPVLDVVPQRPPVLPVFPVGTPPGKILSHCNIELLIDISQSMNEMDGTGKLSKFEWCRDQVRDLARILQPYQKTITITTFNNDYDTYEDCDLAQIEQIYSQTSPAMNTGLMQPLLERCHAALAKGRKANQPTVIAVITDGLPNIPIPPSKVNEALIPFTHELQSDTELNITMLQIGDTFEGRDFCVDLDDNLVKEGAKYDVIDTKTFGELKQINLPQALVDAVTHKQSVFAKMRPDDNQLFQQKDAPRQFSATSHPATFQDDFTLRAHLQKSPELKQKDKELHELEQRLLNQ
ncbi:MAG: hypothetical protein P4L53_23865 [Candidatus Obscuribacterales bacterium]|nr:hypothetical protein [Candidatus Obscuribacterales bacterium]